MQTANEQYSNLITDILQSGTALEGRNGAFRRIPVLSARFDSTPLVSIRKTAWKTAIHEMEWFMSGSSNIYTAHESIRPWWQPYASKQGYVFHNYGKQFRRFNGADGSRIDQIMHAIELLRTDPSSRRNVMTTWNSAEMMLPETQITNCHGTAIQLFVENDEVSLFMYQRSCDMVVGVPHNWIQYWALLTWMAASADLQVGRLYWTGGDCHVYGAHNDIAQKITQTSVSDPTPELVYGGERLDVPEFLASDFSLDGEYKPVLTEKAPLIV